MSNAATTSIETEYLMTLHAPIAGAPQRIDEALTIFHSDSGRVADFARRAAGETLGAEEMYFVTAPVFQTADSRYAWLNTVQAIGRAVALKGGAGGYVRYEVFAIR